MGSLSKYEQETVINFNAGEQRAVVVLCQDFGQLKLQNL